MKAVLERQRRAKQPVPRGRSDEEARKPAVAARSRLAAQEVVSASAYEAEETLVVDDRAGLSPAQMVERRLGSLLRNVLLPVSHMRSTIAVPGRRHC